MMKNGSIDSLVGAPRKKEYKSSPHATLPKEFQDMAATVNDTPKAFKGHSAAGAFSGMKGFKGRVLP